MICQETGLGFFSEGAFTLVGELVKVGGTIGAGVIGGKQQSDLVKRQHKYEMEQLAVQKDMLEMQLAAQREFDQLAYAGEEGEGPLGLTAPGNRTTLYLGLGAAALLFFWAMR